MPNPVCRQYLQLKSLLGAAMHTYIEGTKALEGATQGAEFERAYQAAENAMVAFVRAREELENHVVSHGCADFEDFTRLRAHTPVSRAS